MNAFTFWKTITVDHANLLERLLHLLATERIRFCVIGGQAVNAYVEPVVSLDLVVAVDDLPRAEALLAGHFTVERFPHSLNVSTAGSDLRVQVQLDPRYGPFVDRARMATVLGTPLPVAQVDDLLSGKVWAASDPTRRATKRQKDLADIARLLERFPELRASVPAAILDGLL